MSCSQCGQPECGGDPCSGAAPVGSVYETLSSALDNFILNFYGSITKTVVDGKVVWTLPCDLTGQIGGYIRDAALGTACYYKEILTDLDIRITNEGIAISAAQSTAEAAQVAANLALAIIATYGDMALQNKAAVNITGGAMSNVAIHNVPAPTVGGDAVNKTYADSIAGGISPRTAVRVASTTNFASLAAVGATIDGVTMALNDRVLVKDQSTTSQNGIYVYNAGALTRATDADGAGEANLNQYYFVVAGTTYAGTGWFISASPGTPGSGPWLFSQFSAASTYSAGVGLLLAGVVFSVDSSIVMERANNLSDVASAATSRTNLGLGAIAVLADTLFTRVANNLSDLASAATARTNLGLGAIATFSDTAFAKVANNLSDLVSPATARTNLGLGAAATFADTAFAKVANNLSDLASIVTARINLGLGTAATFADTTFAKVANNLSDLASAATARTNLGLGSIATQLANAVAVTGGTITGLTELKANFGIFTAPIAYYDSASGGLYLGYGAGTALIRSVADNSGTASPISFYLGAVCPAFFDSTGLVMQGAYKAQQPAAPTAGIDLCNKTYVDSMAGGAGAGRINVRNYGALGNGSTNDTAAINSAIAAMTNGSTLYFPAGKYLVTPGGLTAFASLSNITVLGDGRSSQLYSTAAAPSTGFLVFAYSCSKVTIRDLALIGSATSRVSGGHGLIVYSSRTLVSGLYITGTSDFGMYIGSGGGFYNQNVQVVGCISDRTLGDGFHFGPVTDSGIYDCAAYYTGDDGLGIGDDGVPAGYPATRIEVVGFQSLYAGDYLRTGGSAHGCGIRIFDGAIDIHVTGGSAYKAAEAGLTCGRFSSTTAFNTRIKLDGFRAYQCLLNSGMYGQINFQFCTDLDVKGCWSEAPTVNGCYGFLDCNYVSVIGNTAKDAAVRAFQCDDGTTTNVAASCTNWSFLNNVCFGAPSNESYYFVAPTGKTINNLIAAGNTESGQSAANYLFTNRLGGSAKVMNNISLGGKAVVNGGSGTSPTVANNN